MMTPLSEEEFATIVSPFVDSRREGKTSSLLEYLSARGPFPPHVVRALALAELEYLWQIDDGAPVELILTQTPGLRADPEAVLELIGVELRWARSKPELAAYQERFPELTVELERLFDLVSLAREAAPVSETLASSLSPAPSPSPGFEQSTAQPIMLGRYQIRQTLGRGGFGEVCQAWDPRLERHVAIKRLFHGSKTTSPESPGIDLLAEARRVATLDHHAIVPVYDVDYHNGDLYIVSRLIEGESLDRRLGRPWDWHQAARAIARIGDALDFAHRRGVIHRDVKPANILIDADGLVYLTDFGLATISSTGHSKSTHVVGTLPYMAPELLDGNTTASRATDIFSLGVVLFQMLTGRLPWQARDLAEMRRHHARQEARLHFPKELDCPEELIEVCQRALQRDPSLRFATAAQMARAARQTTRSRNQSADRSADATTSQLPAPLTPIVGRDQELDWLRDTILRQQRRLVTITGMGGVGKSRLALELGWEIADEPGYRVYFVELAMVHQPTLVLPRILETLGLTPSARQTPQEALEHFLDTHRIALVLDNFEQILSAGPHLTSLLKRCPGLQVVVTSRIPLDLQGEQVFSLTPLPQPSGQISTPPWSAASDALPADVVACGSVELFIQRARQVLPEFRVDSTNIVSICNICQRLDGLPLAIELAAGRLANFSMKELESRLTPRKLLTQPGPSDSPTRHRTLWNTIQWSVDLMSPAARDIFHALSMFESGATRESLAAVFHDRVDEFGQPDWETACDEVIVSSLVRVDRNHPQSRLFMLETVREFAGIEFEKSPERDRRRAAFGDYFLRLAETATRRHASADQAMWLQTIEREYDNLRGVLAGAVAGHFPEELGLRMAASLWWFWETRGMLEEGLFWLRSLLASHADTPPSVLGAAFNAAGNLARKRGRIAEAEGYYQQALELRATAGDERGVGATWQNLGNIALERGDWSKADELYQKSLVIRRSLGDEWGAAMVLSNLALAALHRTDADLADTYIAEAYPLFARHGDVRNQARLIDIQGELAQSRGQLPDAIRLHDQSRQMRESLGDRMGIGLSCHNLAWAHFRAGDQGAAVKYLRETLDIWREIGADGQIPFTLELAAELAFAWQRNEEAASLMAASLNLSHDEPQIENDPCLRRIRERLTLEVFEKAVEAGRTWSVEGAGDVARQLLLELAPEL